MVLKYKLSFINKYISVLVARIWYDLVRNDSKSLNMAYSHKVYGLMQRGAIIMSDKKRKKEEVVFLPIFVGLGVGMGSFLGSTLLKDMGIGISLGIAIGAIIGGILDYIKSKK